MANKTPFEIRTELLSQAQSILNERNYIIRMRLETDWNHQYEIAASKNDNSIPSYPQMPIITTEEIIEEARKLNDFVSNG